MDAGSCRALVIVVNIFLMIRINRNDLINKLLVVGLIIRKYFFNFLYRRLIETKVEN